MEAAEHDAEWRAEIPAFVAEIKDIFEPWQLKEFLDTPRRLGALGHAASEEGHQAEELGAENKKQYEDALVKVGLAMDLRPNDVEFHGLKKQIQERAGDPKTANISGVWTSLDGAKYELVETC